MRIYKKRIDEYKREYYRITDEEYELLSHWKFRTDEDVIQAVLQKYTPINSYINRISFFTILAGIIVIWCSSLQYLQLGAFMEKFFTYLFPSFVISGTVGYLFCICFMPAILKCPVADDALTGLYWHIILKIFFPIIFGIFCLNFFK